MKCKIPSFVADFVLVDAWISDTNEVFTKDTHVDYGKILINMILSCFLLHHFHLMKGVSYSCLLQFYILVVNTFIPF